MYVYRNGVRIGRSTVSTGKPGKATPTGVFTVLQKKVQHESSIYKGAKMPHMQRLTWTGIALHAGHLPGYPASAGCVRLPVDFAAKLYSVTTLGTTVIIADNRSTPSRSTQPGLLFSGKTGTPPATRLRLGAGEGAQGAGVNYRQRCGSRGLRLSQWRRDRSRRSAASSDCPVRTFIPRWRRLIGRAARLDLHCQQRRPRSKS